MVVIGNDAPHSDLRRHLLPKKWLAVMRILEVTQFAVNGLRTAVAVHPSDLRTLAASSLLCLSLRYLGVGGKGLDQDLFKPLRRPDRSL